MNNIYTKANYFLTETDNCNLKNTYYEQAGPCSLALVRGRIEGGVGVYHVSGGGSLAVYLALIPQVAADWQAYAVTGTHEHPQI